MKKKKKTVVQVSADFDKPEERMVTLRLNEEAAKSLLSLTGDVCGGTSSPFSTHTDAVYDVLYELFGEVDKRFDSTIHARKGV